MLLRREVVRTEDYPVVHRAFFTAPRRLALAVVLLGGGWLARAMFRRVEVVGDSMRPTLEPGDRLLLRRPGRWAGAPLPGDLVAVVDPRQPVRVVVKRLVSVGPAGLEVHGDNAVASTDSRVYGPVALAAIRGRVVYRYHPAPRRGRLARPADGRSGDAPPE